MASIIHYHGITSEKFNIKYKNLLRDFYVYNFKGNRNLYKVVSGGKKNPSQIDYNKTYNSATLTNDTQRINAIMRKKAGITYSETELNDRKCISLDSREFTENPFHGFYTTCHTKSWKSGSNFALFYLLMMYLENQTPDGQKYEFRYINEKYGSEQFKAVLSNVIKHGIIKKYFEVDSKSSDLDFNCKKISVNNANKIFSSIEGSLTSISSKYGTKELDKDSGASFKDFYTDLMLASLKAEIEEVGGGWDIGFSEYKAEMGINHILRLFFDVGKYDKTNKFDIPSVNQLTNKVKELCDFGFLVKDSKGCRISPVRMPTFNSPELEYRFFEMIRFFTETQTLGTVGTFVRKRLNACESNLAFKHNYFIRALNDYNLIDLLYAIKNKKWVKLEYRNANLGNNKYKVIYCYPVAVRESVTDGRQFLIYYNPFCRSVMAKRIEFIDTVTVAELSEDIDIAAKVKLEAVERDIKLAKKRLLYTWGSSFPLIDGGNCNSDLETNEESVRGLHTVEVTLEYDNTKEKYIPKRFRRETALRNESAVKISEEKGKSESDKNIIRAVFNVTDPHEVIKWVRTFTVRVVSIVVDGEPYREYEHDIRKLCDAYGKLRYGKKVSSIYEELFEDSDTVSKSSSRIEIKDKVSDSLIFDEIEFKPHDLLFNEYYSDRCELLGELLFNEILGNSALNREQISEEKKAALPDEIVRRVFERKVLFHLEDEKLLHEQVEFFVEFFANKEANIVTSFSEPPKNIFALFPLTRLEIAWLKNVLCDKKAELFLDKTEREHLLTALNADNNTYENLFSFDDVDCYNQFDSEAFYSKENCKDIFRMLLNAVHSGNSLNITYKNGKHSGEYLPYKIEYSKRDDIFRVYTMNVGNKEKHVLNLERIVECSIGNYHDPEKIAELSEKYLSEAQLMVTVVFQDTKNVPDRILSEFAPWKKECVYNDKTKMFTMTLFYDAHDQYEVAVRLLGYGKNIFITKESIPFHAAELTMTELIKGRISEQVRIFDREKEVGEKGDRE